MLFVQPVQRGLRGVEEMPLDAVVPGDGGDDAEILEGVPGNDDRVF